MGEAGRSAPLMSPEPPLRAGSPPLLRYAGRPTSPIHHCRVAFTTRRARASGMGRPPQRSKGGEGRAFSLGLGGHERRGPPRAPRPIRLPRRMKDMETAAVATEPFIHLANVAKSYGKGAKTHLAISNATFDVMPGELASLVGPSGCGKSTLLKILAGLHPHDGGTVTMGSAESAVRSGPRRRHGVPAAAAPEVADDHRQRPAAGRDPRPAGEGEPGTARASCWRWSAWPAPRTSAPTSSPAACSSAPRSPAR